MGELARRAHERARRAQAIADLLRGDDRLHRLGMATVFVLEDVAFSLSQLADNPIRRDGTGTSLF